MENLFLFLLLCNLYKKRVSECLWSGAYPESCMSKKSPSTEIFIKLLGFFEKSQHTFLIFWFYLKNSIDKFQPVSLLLISSGVEGGRGATVTYWKT